MDTQEYVKELRELYKSAKERGDIATAFEILRELGDYEHDPCGVEDFRKQAEEATGLFKLKEKPQCKCDKPDVKIQTSTFTNPISFRLPEGTQFWKCCNCGKVLGIVD